MFEDTTAFEKIEAMDARINIVQGGTSAGKTISILARIIDLSSEEHGATISICTDTFPNLRRGAMKDFRKLIEAHHRQHYFSEKQTTHIFTNLYSGTVIEFFSADEMGALGARRDYLFINEANRISYEAFTQLEVRTEKQIWLDFNPVNEFWAHTELLKRPDVEFLKLNYLDNEGLSENVVKTLEMRRGDGTSNWWKVYGLGEIGSLEGNVYSGWIPLAEEEIRKGKLIRYGLDFGFSNDETALASLYELEDGLGVVQEVYQRGILGSQYPEILKSHNVDHSVLIVADSARPEIIAEIKNAGYRCVGADKGPGSVLRGIDRVQQRKIYYCGKDLEREFMTYGWRKKRSGEILDEPQDGNDHCLAYDTKIKTLRGNKKIGEMVGTSGWLWTEDRKLRYYRNVRKTGREQVYEIQLDDGTSFKCSSEHIIYTLNRGPVPAYLLNTKDMIQLDTYESRSYKRKETKIQRSKLLARCKSWILSKRTAQATFDSQGSLGVSQWASSKGSSDRPYRQRQEQQSNRKSSGCFTLSEQQKRFRKDDSQEACALRFYKGESESLAFFGGRPKMALESWQRIVEREKANRKEMCSLWEKLLYTRPFDFCTLLLWKLQNAGKAKKAQGSTRVYAKMRSRKALGVEDVYCMDVFDTSTFALHNGVVVSNCLDAIRYAVDDLSRPMFDF